jgi:hypothetical protein
VKPLRERNREDGEKLHAKIEPRIYEGEWPHDARLKRVWELLRQYIESCADKSITELGCGTADLSGPLSSAFEVLGFDCSAAAIDEAKKRWPQGMWLAMNLDDVFPAKTGILVMCEVLEHLPDPKSVVKKWAPFAEYMVISHPLGEPEGDLSGGEHQWEFDEADLRAWFTDNGFEVMSLETVKMGAFTDGIAIGRRI